MYVVMGMICLLAIFQTIASSSILSGLVDLKEIKIEKGDTHQILIGILYLASAYQIYIMGFDVFAGFAAAHAFLYTMTALFKRIKS